MRLINAKELERQTKEAFKESPVVMGMLLRWIRKQPTIAPESLRPKWISVEDRLPEGADGKSIAENVIAFLNNGEVAAQVCTGWINGDKWYLLTDECDYHTIWGKGAVTHWMPLPEPPDMRGET